MDSQRLARVTVILVVLALLCPAAAASGVYFARLIQGVHTTVSRLVLVR